ncbi:hypothetical protein CR513_04639, partial [Mucuna pruriens]
MVKADPHKQAKAESVSDNQGENHIPSRSDFRANQRAEFYSHPPRTDSIKRSRPQQLKAEIMSAHLVLSSIQVNQLDSKVFNNNSSSLPPPMELKPLPRHLQYAYLDTKQQLPIIIANNLHQEQEDKLLQFLRQRKKAIGWKLSDLQE